MIIPCNQYYAWKYPITCEILHPQFCVCITGQYILYTKIRQSLNWNKWKNEMKVCKWISGRHFFFFFFFFNGYPSLVKNGEIGRELLKFLLVQRVFSMVSLFNYMYVLIDLFLLWELNSGKAEFFKKLRERSLLGIYSKASLIVTSML